ncbi:hypothetical protein DFH09DRAFT_1069882 [Mycena vulgaris]|nr:hypothetical protein DFH09DRAFT_1069882 [Mycena vulgaris]
MLCQSCNPSGPPVTLVRALEAAKLAVALDNLEKYGPCIAAYQDSISLLDDFIRWEAPKNSGSDLKRLADIYRSRPLRQLPAQQRERDSRLPTVRVGKWSNHVYEWTQYALLHTRQVGEIL